MILASSDLVSRGSTDIMISQKRPAANSPLQQAFVLIYWNGHKVVLCFVPFVYLNY